MLGLAESGWFRAGGYLLVAALAFAAGRRQDRDAPGAWPPFWLLTGALLLVMAVGRAGDVGDVLGDSIRDRAVERGWYESRRPLQAAVVGALGAAWFVAVITAIWRVPERRRRYLPMITVMITLAAFAAIRLVSLHHVDTLLHRRHVVGLRVGTAIEIVLLLLAAACTFWTPRTVRHHPVRHHRGEAPLVGSDDAERSPTTNARATAPGDVDRP